MGLPVDINAGNRELTLLPSAARTVTTDTSDQDNAGGRGVHVIINVTANASVAGMTPSIQGKDPVSGVYYTLLAGAAITVTGTTVLKVYPGITASATAVSDALPKTWRVHMVAGDASSVTYSIGAEVVL